MERVELFTLGGGTTRLRRWRTGRLNGWNERFVTIGTIAGGRIFTEHTEYGAAWLHDDEQSATEMVSRWLSDGRDWAEHPACFDAKGQPADCGTWTLRGQEWLPNDG